MDELDNENARLKQQLREMDAAMKTAALQVNDTNDFNRSILNASHSDIKDLNRQIDM
jgi:hypothetical protein